MSANGSRPSGVEVDDHGELLSGLIAELAELEYQRGRLTERIAFHVRVWAAVSGGPGHGEPSAGGEPRARPESRGSRTAIARVAEHLEASNGAATVREIAAALGVSAEYARLAVNGLIAEGGAERRGRAIRRVRPAG